MSIKTIQDPEQGKFRIHVDDILGHGQTWEVCKSESEKHNCDVAIKTFKKTPHFLNISDKFLQAVQAQQQVMNKEGKTNPFIVQVIGKCESSNNVYMIFELCDRKNLKDQILDKKTYTREEAL